MAKKTIYEYVVLHHETDDEGEVTVSTIIVDVARVLAASEQEVGMIAARAIPEDYADRLAEVEITIRPF